jgi:hypothetical protein
VDVATGQFAAGRGACQCVSGSPGPHDSDFPSRDFGHGHGWGLAPSSADATAHSAGVVCLLTTADDRPTDWVNAGQALQRILLTSTAVGVAAALHSQPLEIGWMRRLIRSRTADNSYPQLIIRLGAVVQSAGSVRRAPTSVQARAS